METVTISKKKYQELKAAKARLDALSNEGRKSRAATRKHTRVDDLVGVLHHVKKFRNKSSVEVQRMIPEIWSNKYTS